jgi:flagellar hook-associated protein 2
MTTISSTGLGSQLPVESIVKATMDVARQPQNLITSTNTGLKSQLSSYGQLQSYVSTFQDKANALTSVTLWSQTVATSSDTSAATVTSGSGAAAGRYSLEVQALAASQTATTTAFPSSSHSLGEGQLTIDLGSWTGDPATFGLKTGSTSVTVDIGPGESSLAAIRDKINAAGAGVTATIINDSSGARLSIRSTQTGEENGFRLTATETVPGDDGGLGLSALNYDPENLPGTGMGLNQSAANAKATLNGIEISSASNTLNNVADGLTLNLTKKTTTAIDISVTQDTASMSAAVNGFVTAYNDLSNFIKNQTKYDSATKTAGKLQGDRTAIGIQNQMRAILRDSSTASSQFSRLSDIGISVQKDGTLQVSTAKLNDALTNVPELKKMLISSDESTASSSGLIYRFKQMAKQVTGTDGPLETRTNGIQSTIDRNAKRIDDMEVRLAATEKRIRAQYEALDTNMSKLSGLSSYMTMQLSAINNS